MEGLKINSAEVGWAAAGAGVVAASVIIPMLPQWIGNYTSLVVGVVLMVASIKFIKEHGAAALAFGAGFAFALDGVIRLLIPSVQAASTPSYLAL